MLKKQITYKDFNDQEVTEVLYFNISKPELLELEVEYDGAGFGALIQGVIDAQDRKKLIEIFKRVVLLAYGEKSEDGRKFVKSDAIRDDFASTAAYVHLFTELATDEKAASEFINGIMPADLLEGRDQDKPVTQAAAIETTKGPDGLSG